MSIENLLSDVEDTFINTAIKVLRKTRIHEESEVKIGNVIKKDLTKLIRTNITSQK